MPLSRQAHDREISLNPAVDILRRTSHCTETARFLSPPPPPSFFGSTQHPLAKLMKRKQLATFQYLGTASSQHRDGFLVT